MPSNQQDTEELHQTSKAIMPLKIFLIELHYFVIDYCKTIEHWLSYVCVLNIQKVYVFFSSQKSQTANHWVHCTINSTSSDCIVEEVTCAYMWALRREDKNRERVREHRYLSLLYSACIFSVCNNAYVHTYVYKPKACESTSEF